MRIAGRPLPIARKGAYKRPSYDGAASSGELREKFKEEFVFSQNGWLQLSKKLDVEWQSAVLRLYERVCEVVRSEYGYEPFVIYGSLLGLVREGGFIGHDVDFDAAFLSRLSDQPLPPRCATSPCP